MARGVKFVDVTCQQCGTVKPVHPSNAYRQKYCSRACAVVASGDGSRRKTPAERLWALVDIRGADECWPYMGVRLAKGYGQFVSPSGSSTPASRAAYMLHHGIDRLDRHTLVCHSCDNPSCCNPAHLWLGSATDNMRDMTQKGRDNRPRGEASGMAKLTDAAVREIRTSREAISALAARFGVTEGAVGYARSGATWRHVDAPPIPTVKQVGEGHHGAKLTDDLVREIRTSRESNMAIAARLGVTSATIRDVRQGKRWRHIDGDVVPVGCMKGEGNHQAKLTERDVLEIRALTERDAVVAARFGVSRATVYHIRHGRIWKHVTASPEVAA